MCGLQRAVRVVGGLGFAGLFDERTGTNADQRPDVRRLLLQVVPRHHRDRQGVRFSLIYEANQTQIRDPDLIYPGQIFTVPQTN